MVASVPTAPESSRAAAVKSAWGRVRVGAKGSGRVGARLGLGLGLG